jgi:hypothetical protein
MIKRMLLFLLLLMNANFIRSQVVEVVLEKEVYTTENTIHFVVKCSSEQGLEITVFTDNYLAMQQKSTLLEGGNPFELKTATMLPGKYFVLVTGNGIHVEKEFFLRR